MSADELYPFSTSEAVPPMHAEWGLLVNTDADTLAELEALRTHCSALQYENQSLAGLVYEKDKVTRLLLANVEAWKQKLDWVEKRKVEEVQRLQACIAEREKLIDQLAQGVGAMKIQLEEWRTAEAANAAAMCRLQELERENSTLLNILHGKCKDNPSVLQLLASLQTVKQDLRLHETENARLVCLLGQRDKQTAFMTSRLEETQARIEHFTWDCTADGGQMAATVRELVIERDRLRAQVAAVCVGRDHQMLVMQEQQHQHQQQLLRQQASFDSATGNQPVDENKELAHQEEVVAKQQEPAAPSEAAAAFSKEEEDKENSSYWSNENACPSRPADNHVVTPRTPQAVKVKPIGSGRLNKAKASTKPKSGGTPVKENCSSSSSGGGGGGLGFARGESTESPGSALASAFNRLTVGAQRSPLGSLTQ